MTVGSHFRPRRPKLLLFAKRSEQRLSEARLSVWNQSGLVRGPLLITLIAGLLLPIGADRVAAGLIYLNIPLIFALSLLMVVLVSRNLFAYPWDVVRLAPRGPTLFTDAIVSLAEISLWPWMLFEAGLRVTIAFLLVLWAYLNLPLGNGIPVIFNLLNPGFWIITGMIYLLASILVIEPVYRMRLLIVITLGVARLRWGALIMTLQGVALILFANFPYWFLLGFQLNHQPLMTILWVFLSPFYLFSFAFLPTFYQRLEARIMRRLFLA
jgi:hypothetical protein